MTTETQEPTLQVRLPHGINFQLISRVIEINELAVCELDYTGKEILDLADHFPGQRIFPGALLIEAMAETTIQLAQRLEGYENKIFALVGVDECRFYHAVRPGKTIRLTAQFESFGHGYGRALCHAFVDDKLVAKTRLAFTEIKIPTD